MIIALLQQSPGGLDGFLISIFPFILIFGVFYFLIILPQRRRQQQLQALVANLKAGDRIITTGGIVGTVASVRENSLIIRSADKSMLEITRAAVAGLQADAETKA